MSKRWIEDVVAESRWGSRGGEESEKKKKKTNLDAWAANILSFLTAKTMGK